MLRCVDRTAALVAAMSCVLAVSAGPAESATRINAVPSGQSYQWRELLQAEAPPRIAHVEVVRDTARDRLVTFGGRRGHGPPFGKETWVREGTSWRRLHTTGGPSQRADYAMVYDIARDEVVLFGGERDEADANNETWVLSGDIWQRREPAHSPPVFRSPVMTYDPVRQETVLVLGATWIWDGVDWHQAAADGPQNVTHQDMAWDQSRQSVISYGGLEWVDGVPIVRGETWAWTGTRWTALEDGPARMMHAMASLGRHVISFGGTAARESTDETWILRRRGWVELDLARRPPASDFAELVDVGRHRALLLPGSADNSPHWSLTEGPARQGD